MLGDSLLLNYIRRHFLCGRPYLPIRTTRFLPIERRLLNLNHNPFLHSRTVPNIFVSAEGGASGRSDLTISPLRRVSGHSQFINKIHHA